MRDNAPLQDSEVPEFQGRCTNKHKKRPNLGLWGFGVGALTSTKINQPRDSRVDKANQKGKRPWDFETLRF